MKKITLLSILCVCVCSLTQAQTHDQANTSATFFPNNYMPSKHFHAITLGAAGGNLFLGGTNGQKGITWNAMETTTGDFNYTSSRNAAKMEYTHWNNLWALKLSNDATRASGAPVTWQNTLQVQLDPDPVMRFCGDFFAQEININAGIGWCDYVFAEDYKLMSLAKLEQYINTYKHLPDVPSEQEVYDNGIAVTEMLQIQMKKIEELTLYILQQQKEIDELKTKIDNKH